MVDVSPTLVTKSDQLNGDDLIGGPILVRIEGVRSVNGDQPIEIKIGESHQPYKPCKTCRRVLAATMGFDASKWIGTWMELYRDPEVMFGKEKVGGIRIRALSCLTEPVTMSFNISRGRKASFVILPLKVEDAPKQPATITEDQFSTILELFDAIYPDQEAQSEERAALARTVLAFAGATGIDKIPTSKFDVVVKKLEEKRDSL